VGVQQGELSVSLTYDGDGNRVRTVVSDTHGVTTTVHIGGYYELTGGVARTYYYHAGQRVAMREGGVTTWLLGDHLGSTSVRANAGGTKLGELRYSAWGVTRYEDGAILTSYRFTGQPWEQRLGLYQMGARWYDPYLNRWLSPDSIVPDPANPQSLNRFAYVYNNPLKYIDPGGQAPVLVAAIPLIIVAAVYSPQIYVAACQLSVSMGQGLAVYGPAMPVYWDQLNQFAGEAKRRVQNLFRGGETSGSTAQPDPNDPWRWSKDYRHNYEAYYGVARDREHAVHHILRQQQQFEETMARAGVNVHDPRWLREVPTGGGRLPSVHQWFTNEWDLWTRTLGRAPTALEIVAQAQALEMRALELFGPVIYRLGGPVDWQTLLMEIAQK
jgi:RHS repeat-associated protein